MQQVDAADMVGIFQVEKLSEHRWKLTNTQTSFVHVSYGTRGEIEENALRQSELWKKRLSTAAPKVKGSAWRNRSAIEIDRMRGKRP